MDHINKSEEGEIQKFLDCLPEDKNIDHFVTSFGSHIENHARAKHFFDVEKDHIHPHPSWKGMIVCNYFRCGHEFWPRDRRPDFVFCVGSTDERTNFKMMSQLRTLRVPNLYFINTYSLKSKHLTKEETAHLLSLEMFLLVLSHLNLYRDETEDV